MSENLYRKIALDGLWRNNTATVQLLGLCPLLACSGSVVNGLGLGLATTVALATSNAAVSLVRNQVPDTIRIPTFVMIIAAFVSCIELVMHAYTYQLYQVLGIFIPLIVTNCAARDNAACAPNTRETCWVRPSITWGATSARATAKPTMVSTSVDLIFLHFAS